MSLNKAKRKAKFMESIKWLEYIAIYKSKIGKLYSS